MLSGQFSFTIPEILSLFGLAQCVYILVYMAFRSGDWRRAVIPALYFAVLGAAFFLDLAARFIAHGFDSYPLWQWAAWFSGPPLCVLLVVQICRIGGAPPAGDYAVLLLPPLSYALAALAARDDPALLPQWLVVAGLGAGVFGMGVVWFHRGLLRALAAEKSGRDRYWLAIALVTVNLLFLAAALAGLAPAVGPGRAMLVRTLLGLGFVYLAGTSLFRIYPQAVKIAESAPKSLSPDEALLLERIEKLIDLDKVYQEPAYGRADLARELQAPEAVVSRLVNLHFGRSLPQLLNEKRVADAQRMLTQTDAPVKTVAAESGFNSIASFNRVFKEIAGETPGAYRLRRRGGAS